MVGKGQRLVGDRTNNGKLIYKKEEIELLRDNLHRSNKEIVDIIKRELGIERSIQSVKTKKWKEEMRKKKCNSDDSK
jgi:hypothetical protein